MKFCMKILWILLITFGCSPRKEYIWIETFGNPENDVSYSVQVTSDYGYLIAGYTTFSETIKKEFWLIKTDNDGNEEWNQYYGGSEDDIAKSVIQTDDSGYAVAGLTWSNSAGESDMWIVKTDSIGNLIWDTQIGGQY